MNRVGDSLFCTAVNEEIVRAFVSKDVEFAVVGGLAVSWYCTDREADDMDLLVNPTVGNSERICIALGSLNLQGLERHAFAKAGVQLRLKDRYYADVITPATGGPTFEEITANAIDGKLFNISVRIPSVTALIRLKENAAATVKEQFNKHRKDIELLNVFHPA